MVGLRGARDGILHSCRELPVHDPRPHVGNHHPSHHGHGCDHGHDHGGLGVHVHAPPGMEPKTALWVSLGLVGSYLMVQVVVGWITGSLAILSDAAHSVSDVSALVVALLAAHLSRQPAEAGTWGWGRAEVLGGFINGLGLLVAVGFILVEAVERLIEGVPEVPAFPVFAVASVGLTINLIGAWFLWRAREGNLNVQAALLHMLADALGSVGAMVAAGFLWMGFAVADVGVSLFIAGLVSMGAFRILRESGRILMEFPPRGVDVGALHRFLDGDAQVQTVDDLRVWSVDGRTPMLLVRVQLQEGDREEVGRRLKTGLVELGVPDPVIEVTGVRPGSGNGGSGL